MTLRFSCKGGRPSRRRHGRARPVHPRELGTCRKSAGPATPNMVFVTDALDRADQVALAVGDGAAIAIFGSSLLTALRPEKPGR